MVEPLTVILVAVYLFGAVSATYIIGERDGGTVRVRRSSTRGYYHVDKSTFRRDGETGLHALKRSLPKGLCWPLLVVYRVLTFIARRVFAVYRWLCVPRDEP